MYKWQPMRDKIDDVAIDFDNTIADTSGFPDFIPGEPLPGCIEMMKKIKERGDRIVIWTARHWGDEENIANYLNYYGIPFDSILCGKKLFKYVIDDKNIAFRNNWDEIIGEVEKFK